MNKSTYVVLLVMHMFACAVPNEDTGSASLPDPTDTMAAKASPVADSVTVVEEIAPWAAPFILEYIGHYEKKAGKGPVPITYIKERRSRDGKDLIAVRLGRSLEGHYTTEQWVYIDSTTKRMWELDVVSDSLVEWSGGKKTR